MSAGGSHEPLGINVGRVGLLAGFTVGGFLVAMVASLLLWILWHRSSPDAAAPVARQVLDARAPIELDALRARQEEILGTYGWVDRKSVIARIPVQRAMAWLATGTAPPDADRVRRHPDRPRTGREAQMPGVRNNISERVQ